MSEHAAALVFGFRNKWLLIPALMLALLLAGGAFQVEPAHAATCTPGLDTDMDGTPDCMDADDDNDGYEDLTEDLHGSDSLDAASTPELCDGIDNDIDGSTDEGYPDTTGDGIPDCLDDDHYSDGTCDDHHAYVDPATCLGHDQDVDGLDDCIDEDDDGDGYDDALEMVVGTDPAVPTDCSAFDIDLDGTNDCTDLDDDNDGFSDLQEELAGTDSHDEGNKPEECDDGVSPYQVDDDCDGTVNEACDQFSDVPTGVGVVVSPHVEVELQFDDVTTTGAALVSQEVAAAPLPDGYVSGSTGTYYEITTNAAFAGSATVCVNYQESDFSAENTLSLLHLGMAGWEDITTSLDTTANQICGSTLSFSPFVVAGQQSVLISLSEFRANVANDQVELSWVTAAEIDNEGFNLLRSTLKAGPYAAVNNGLIPAKGVGIGGAQYTYTDTDVVPGETYFYKLQDVENTGIKTDHGPLTITVADGERAAFFESNGAAGDATSAGAVAAGNKGYLGMGGCSASGAPTSWGDAMGLLLLMFAPILWGIRRRFVGSAR